MHANAPPHHHHHSLLISDFQSFMRGALSATSSSSLDASHLTKPTTIRLENGGNGDDERKTLVFDFVPVSKSVVRFFNVVFTVRSVATAVDGSHGRRYAYTNFVSKYKHFGLYNVKLNVLFKEILVSHRTSRSVADEPRCDDTEGGVETRDSLDFLSCLGRFFVSLPRLTAALQNRDSANPEAAVGYEEE